MEYNEVYVTKTQEEIIKNAPVYTAYGKRNARILTFGKDGKPFVIEFKKWDKPMKYLKRAYKGVKL